MLTDSSTDGPAFHTRSHTQNTSSSTTSTPHWDTASQISQEPTTSPQPFIADCLEALLQMQKTDPFCKCISKKLLNGKAPHHEFDTFTHVKGLLYKHVMDAGKKFLALVIPKSWKYTVPPPEQWKTRSLPQVFETCIEELCEKDPTNWDKYLNQVLASYRIMPNLATAESPFFLVYGRDPNQSTTSTSGTHATFSWRS